VPFVHRLQDRLQEHFRDRVRFRKRLVDDADPAFLAFVFFEDDANHPPSGDPRRIEHKDVIPFSPLGTDVGDQGLKPWSIIILAALDGISIFADDREAASLGKLSKGAALGVY
jgi:hypothetical protein